MTITAFLPIFLLLVLWAIRSPKHWLQASIVGSIFQAASPIVLHLGGRQIGLSPCYFLLPLGLWFLVLGSLRNQAQLTASERRHPIAIWVFVFFSVYTIFASLLLPKLLQGQVFVMPPRLGITVEGALYPLRLASTNFIQSLYVMMNAALVLCCYSVLTSGQANLLDVARACRVGLVIILVFGFYQLLAHKVGLPWPYEVINSNAGVKQLTDQTVMGFKRMSSTFLEPGMMALHLTGLVALAFAMKFNWLLCWLGATAVILSTSTTAILTAMILLFMYQVMMSKFDLVGIFKLGFKLILVGSATVGGLALLDLIMFDGLYFQRILFEKAESSSGLSRLQADIQAYKIIWDSYGLGIGVGSHRASSWLANNMAATGLIGTVCLAYILSRPFGAVLGHGSTEFKAVSLGCCGLLLSAFISVPDLALPLIWLLLGAVLATASLPQLSHGSTNQSASPSSCRGQIQFASKRGQQHEFA